MLENIEETNKSNHLKFNMLRTEMDMSNLLKKIDSKADKNYTDGFNQTIELKVGVLDKN